MKMLSLVLLFVFQVSFGQNISVVLLDKKPLEAENYIGTDDYGGVYFINKNILYKNGKDDRYQFSDLQLGAISSVDLINPLKIALFYQDMNTVIFLDRHLIEINRVRFNALPGFRMLSFAATASNNNLWTLNVGAQAIEIYNYLTGQVVAKSLPISSQIIARDSNFNFCWLLLENSLKCYNTYGALVREIPVVNFTDFAENNGRLVGKTKDGFVFLKKNAEQFIPIDLPVGQQVKDFFLNDNKLYIYDGKIIYTYQFNEIINK